MKYIIDSRYFDGTCLTSMSDDIHSDYGGETLEALREREKNPHLVAVSPGRMTQLVKRYTRALCKPFREITEERYYDLWECLPPARWKNGYFFVGEPYYGDLYPFCFRSQERFFMAERSIRLSDGELSRQIREHAERLNRRPALVKGTPEVRYMAWYRSDVAYIPYSFILDGKKRFFRNLAHGRGLNFTIAVIGMNWRHCCGTCAGTIMNTAPSTPKRRTSSSSSTGCGRTNTRWKSRATCSTSLRTVPMWTFTATCVSIRPCSITASIHASFSAISLTSYAP